MGEEHVTAPGPLPGTGESARGPEGLPAMAAALGEAAHSGPAEDRTDREVGWSAVGNDGAGGKKPRPNALCKTDD